MKRTLIPTFLMALATTAFAHEGHEHAAGKTVTLTGEVVDITCYMQHPASATGADHAKCAKSCLAKGLPVGFLASNGQLYTLIGSGHETITTKVADFVGTSSTVTGNVLEQHGMKAIALTSISAASATKATAGKASAKTPTTNEAVVSYTCEMDPDVHSDKPGTCPKCGMTLVPEKKK